MRNIIMIFALLSSFITTACSEAAFGVANIPTKLSDVDIKKDISYGDKKLQNLDIYIPQNLAGDKAPVLIFIHGGRWTFGNKDQYAFIGNNFAQNGYVTVMINHRKFPEVKFPTFVEDGAQATAWVYKNIENYGGDTENIFISGHSSGAHIGALITADNRYLEKYGLSPNIINAFAGMAGPYDFTPNKPDLKKMFGPPENYPQMKVTTFIDGKEPPMLLLWGKKDKTVWEENIDKLSKGINEQNGQVRVIKYDDIDHIGIIKNFAWVDIGEKFVMNGIISFFKKHTK